PGGLTAGNYSFTTGASAAFTINPRPVTVTAAAKSKVYGYADPMLTYQITSGTLAFTDGFSGALARAAGVNVGTRAITQGNVALGSNYALTFVAANLTITTRPLSVNAVASSKTYGNADPMFAWTLSGFAAGENAGNVTVTGSAACTRTTGENVLGGPYTITCAPGGLASSNYSFTTGTTAGFTIAARPITVTAHAKSKAWGQADPALTYSLTSGSLVGADPLSGALDRAPGENAGTYAIGRGTLTAGTNYALTYVGADLTIRRLTIVGFHQPVEMTPAAATTTTTGGRSWNVVKGGSTVPLKFNVWNEGVELKDVSAVRAIGHSTTSCVAGDADVVPLEATGGTGLRYDLKEGQFIFNWQVPKGANGCYHVTLTAADGTALVGAYFKTK
ncbi:MAG: MBG domain-containing protein, partial [Acidimicrobiales bacterium]